jgi:4-hydroxybenzoyl-CoA thioesterase
LADDDGGGRNAGPVARRRDISIVPRDQGARVTSFTFRRQFRIEWGDCDPAGIAFNPRFFQFFDTNTWMMFEAALGVGMQELNKAFGIAGIVLVDVQGNFLKPAAFGDSVELTSRVKEFRRSSFEVEHRLTNGADMLVEGSETRVWAKRHPSEPHRITPAQIPPEVIAKFT